MPKPVGCYLEPRCQLRVMKRGLLPEGSTIARVDQLGLSKSNDKACVPITNLNKTFLVCFLKETRTEFVAHLSALREYSILWLELRVNEISNYFL